MNSNDAIKAFVTHPDMQKRLAKHIVLKCFRNSVLEDFHAGTIPASKAGDYSDVFVQTPYGDIPWNDLSRIDNAEMKVLMTDVANRTYQFIQELFDEQQSANLFLKLAEKDLVPEWDDPI